MLEIKNFVFGPFYTNTYVVSDGQGHVLLIDPACSDEYEQNLLLRYITNASPRPDQRDPDGTNNQLQIIATHGHLDHLWGASWACEHWHSSVLMNEADIPMAQAMQQQYDLFGIRRQPSDFRIQPLNNFPSAIINHKLEIIPTPGHTPGSVCLYFPEDKVLFSGDTLFQMGYGRTDLPGGDTGQLIRSLERLFELPPDVRVYPGHGEPTTIGAERR